MQSESHVRAPLGAVGRLLQVHRSDAFVAAVSRVAVLCERGESTKLKTNRGVRRRVLLISNRVMHYRVPIYNYFAMRFREEGYCLSVRANELQSENQHEINFDFRLLPFRMSLYKTEIDSLKPDVVIMFLHMKDLLFWPLLHWLKWRGTKTLLWTKGVNLDDPRNPLRNLLFHYTHTLVDGIVLYSPHERKYVRPRNRGKITIAPNTINHAVIPSVTQTVAEIKAEFGIPFEKVVLFVGRMDVGNGRKKVDHLVEVFSDEKRPRAGAVLVGSGMSDLTRGRLNHRSILYLGEVHDPHDMQISKIFKMADVFCIPGHVGLGMVQAFFWGLPIVTEEGKQPPEIHYLVNGFNGFIVPENDVQALRDRIVELLDNDALRKELSVNARKSALEQASVEAMFQGFLDGVRRLESDPDHTGGERG